MLVFLANPPVPSPVYTNKLRIPGTKHPVTQIVPDFLIVAFRLDVLP